MNLSASAIFWFRLSCGRCGPTQSAAPSNLPLSNHSSGYLNEELTSLRGQEWGMGCCWWNCRGIPHPEFVRNRATVSRRRNFLIYLRILSKVGYRILPKSVCTHQSHFCDGPVGDIRCPDSRVGYHHAVQAGGRCHSRAAVLVSSAD